MNRDIFGVPRGRCTCGDCIGYMRPTDGLKCAYCECVPAKHVNLTKDNNGPCSASETLVHRDKEKGVAFSTENDAVPFIKTEDVQPNRECLPLPQLNFSSCALDIKQAPTEQNGNQLAQALAFHVPEVDSSSDVLLEVQVPSADRPKLSTMGKRHASDPGGNSESKKKKQRQQTSHPKQEKVSIDQIEMKPCKLLHMSHVPYTEIPRSRGESRVKGVYKIAHNWETIYVGKSIDCVFKQLWRQFSGSGQPELFHFLKSLDRKELEKVSVYWLDETEHIHSCGKKSYLECIGKLQGEKPRFSGRNVPGRSKSEAASKEKGTPKNETSSPPSMQKTTIPSMTSSDEDKYHLKLSHQVDSDQTNFNSFEKQRSSSDETHSAEEMHLNSNASNTTRLLVNLPHQLDSTSDVTGKIKDKSNKEDNATTLEKSGHRLSNHQADGERKRLHSVTKQKSSDTKSEKRASEKLHHTLKITTSTTASSVVNPLRQYQESASNKDAKVKTGNKPTKSDKTGFTKHESDRAAIKKPSQVKSKSSSVPFKDVDTDKSHNSGQESGEMSGDKRISPDKPHFGTTAATILPRSTEFIDRMSKEKKCYNSETRQPDQQLSTNISHDYNSGQSVINTVNPHDKAKSGKGVGTIFKMNITETKKLTCDITKKAKPLTQAKTKTSSDVKQQSNMHMTTNAKSKVTAKDKDLCASDGSLLATIMSEMDELAAPVRSGKDKAPSSKMVRKITDVLHHAENKHLSESTSTSYIRPLLQCGEAVKVSYPNQAKRDESSSEKLAETHSVRDITSKSNNDGKRIGIGLSDRHSSSKNFDSVGLQAGTDIHSNRPGNQQDIYTDRQQFRDSYLSLETISPSRHPTYSESRETEVNSNKQRSPKARSDRSDHGESRSRDERSNHHRHHRPGNRDDRTDRKERADSSRSSNHHTHSVESLGSSSASSRHHASTLTSNSDDDLLPQIHPPRLIKDYNHTSSHSYAK